MLAMRNNGSRTVNVPDRASKPYKCRFVLTRLLLFAGVGLATVSPSWAQLVVNTGAGGTIRSGVPAQDVACSVTSPELRQTPAVESWFVNGGLTSSGETALTVSLRPSPALVRMDTRAMAAWR